MSMVINTNIQATRTHNVYNKNNDYMNQALTRVATGQKINSAKDGAANWAISEKMRERIRANDQANQNVQNDTALLKTAQGGIDNTIDILKTLKERALNSANDSNINTDRSAIATEVYQLLEQINDNAAKVKFNGRTLLNGDYDNGAADMFPVAETSATSTKATPADNPTALGTNAVYKLETNAMRAWDTAGSSTAAVADTTKLVDLVKSADVTSGAAKNKLFADGDILKFTWKEDGVAVQRSVQVTTALTVDDLAKKLAGNAEDSMSAAWVAAGGAINDGDSNPVKDSGGTAQTATASTGQGVFAVGDKNVKITDFAVEVTDQNGEVKTTAQDAIKFTGVQQAQAPTTGSHTVYAIEGLTDGTDAITSATKIPSVQNTNSDTMPANGKTIVIKMGDTTLLSTTSATNKTLGELATEFNNANENIKMFVAGEDGDDVLFNDEDTVTQNTLDGTENLTSNGGIYFVGKNGATVDQITIETDGSIFGGTKYSVGLLQKEGAGSSGSSSNSMTFHVGGEANFYMDINIKTMTTQSLLGSDSKTFATMFTDKATARDAVGIIDTAIQTALNEQTKLGAMESRLGYTSDNITTMNENLEAADSVYRDSDIAKEMTNYMKYTVLAQASQYMLAQTSQNAFSVLNLLQA